ncbi:MAG: hypothetical protein JO297_02850, partial [Nitrososphaeraceae archaeon]|nr:hypothetical protein [Nitrososphaeraceae archaeon]
IAHFTNWVDIPPPTYFILTSKDPLQLRPGDHNKTIGAQLKSTTGIVPNLVSFIKIENNSALPIKLITISHKVNNNNSSIEPASFDISVLNNAPVGQYTIPILANISEGSKFLPEFIHIKNPLLSVPTYAYMLTPVNLTLKVLEPLTFQQWFKEVWDTYGSLISLFGGGLAAGAASLVFDRLKNTRRHNDMDLDKH